MASYWGSSPDPAYTTTTQQYPTPPESTPKYTNETCPSMFNDPSPDGLIALISVVAMLLGVISVYVAVRITVLVNVDSSTKVFYLLTFFHIVYFLLAVTLLIVFLDTYNRLMCTDWPSALCFAVFCIWPCITIFSYLILCGMLMGKNKEDARPECQDMSVQEAAAACWCCMTCGMDDARRYLQTLEEGWVPQQNTTNWGHQLHGSRVEPVTGISMTLNPRLASLIRREREADLERSFRPENDLPDYDTVMATSDTHRAEPHQQQEQSVSRASDTSSNEASEGHI